MDFDQARVVLVHDWLTGMRGGERCLEILCRRWPGAPLYTVLHKRGSVTKVIERRPIHTSFLGRLPSVHRYYRWLLPLMPTAPAFWHLSPCDLVISLSHCVAKAVHVPEGTPHVCYCFTPMRYAWSQRRAYFGEERPGRLKTVLLNTVLGALRRWDRRTADRVSHFVAISQTVRERIREYYERESEVIYPPVDTDFFCPAAQPRESYYLVVSAFAPYKRLDIAIEACNRLGRQLVLIGSGPEEKRLRRMAGPTIQFLGWQPDVIIRDHYRRCRALLFPGEEDFGIVPVEAMAAGAPVIALARGGATETVLPLNRPRRAPAGEPTGIWFDEQTADCLAGAMQMLEHHVPDFNPSAARQQALRFSTDRFVREFFSYLQSVLTSRQRPTRKAA
jgi:glycosyltransferase involved in cell wall biosynthesis